MDFHGLTRRELQTLCKRNKIPANITNIAMADALSALPFVEGLDELTITNQVAPRTPSVSRSGNNRTDGSETTQQLSRARRTTARKTVGHGNNKIHAPPNTPAASTTAGRRKTQVASTVTVRTRQSVRLLEKSMTNLSFNDNKGIKPVPVAAVKIDFSDQNLEFHHSSSDFGEWKNSDDDKKAINDEIVSENVIGEEALRIEDKVSDEISANVTEGHHVERDRGEDQIMDSQSLKTERGTKEIPPEADLKETVSDADADDDSDSHESVAVRRDILADDATTDQVLSDETASDADDESDPQKCVLNHQDDPHIAEDDFTETYGSERDCHDDSALQKSVANQQVSNLMEAASTVSDDIEAAFDDTTIDFHNSVVIQHVILADEDDSNQVPIKETSNDSAAADDSDPQKSLFNQQDTRLAVAEADSTESDAIETEPGEADASADAADPDSDSRCQKSIECVEELVQVSLLHTYEDETKSNPVKLICPSSLGNTKSLVDVCVMPAEELDMASGVIANPKNDSHSDSDSGPRPTQSASNQKLTNLVQQPDNKENINVSNGMSIMKLESKKDIAVDDDDSNLKSLNDKSLRQLNKMLKKKLQISNNNKNEVESINKNQVG